MFGIHLHPCNARPDSVPWLLLLHLLHLPICAKGGGRACLGSFSVRLSADAAAMTWLQPTRFGANSCGSAAAIWYMAVNYVIDCRQPLLKDATATHCTPLLNFTC